MVVDGEGFVGCVRGLRDALAGLPVVVGLLPSSRAAHGVVARGYDVFGDRRLHKGRHLSRPADGAPAPPRYRPVRFGADPWALVEIPPWRMSPAEDFGLPAKCGGVSGEGTPFLILSMVYRACRPWPGLFRPSDCGGYCCGE